MEISIWLPSKGGQGRWRGGVRAVGPVAQGGCWDADAAGGQVVGKRQRQRQRQRQIRWARDKDKDKEKDKKKEKERRRGETAIYFSGDSVWDQVSGNYNPSFQNERWREQVFFPDVWWLYLLVN